MSENYHSQLNKIKKTIEFFLSISNQIYLVYIHVFVYLII